MSKNHTIPGFDLDQDEKEEEKTVSEILEEYDLECEGSHDQRTLLTVPDDDFDSDFDSEENFEDGLRWTSD